MLGVNSLILKDGTGFLQALVTQGIKVDLKKRSTVKSISDLILTLPEEQRAVILAWEVDELSDVEPPLTGPILPAILPDSKVVNHVNSVTIWTLCLTSLMIIGAISWNIVVNHEYPRVSLALVAIGPITLCALWVIGVLRNRQSIMSVIIGGDSQSQDTMVQTIAKAVLTKIAGGR